MCRAAGINGFKTNHSLRVSLATRLFQSGIDEQLIMAKTGHRSTDGVRQYKRVNDEQLEILSQVAQGQAAQCHKNLLKESDMNVMPPIRLEPEML